MSNGDSDLDLRRLGAVQIAETQQLTKAELGQLLQTKRELRQTQLLFVGSAAILGSAVAWYVLRSREIKTKYGNLINLIDAARSGGVYTGPSGMSTLWAFEYGRLGSFFGGFINQDLPVAIVYAFYDKQFNAKFIGSDKGLSSLISFQKLANNTQLDAISIICQGLFSQTAGDQPPSICLPDCHIQDANSSLGTTAQYLTAASGGASGGIMAGMVAGQAFGPAGAVVGFSVIMGMSLFSTSQKIKQQAATCKASLQNCVNVNHLSCNL